MDLLNKKKERIVITLDWDDTILPTKWLTINNMITISSDVQIVTFSKTVDQCKKLDELAKKIIIMVNKIMEKGICIIITNATIQWVCTSCKYFLPNICAVLNKIRIVSARDMFQPSFPNDIMKWKEFAFHDELFAIYDIDPDIDIYNVISLGDSLYERSAVQKVGEFIETGIVLTDMLLIDKNRPKIIIKSIKFVENPTIEQISFQINCLTSEMNAIVNWKNNLDLMLKIK
jgi:hypothetical protein